MERFEARTDGSHVPDGVREALAPIQPDSRVLVVGDAAGTIAQTLDAHGCDITGVVLDDRSTDEARVFCSIVGSTALDALALPQGAPAAFDAIVFDGSLERFYEPWRVLHESRAVLHPDGIVVAVLPNVNHGSIRLALLKGALPRRAFGSPQRLQGFSASSLHDLFVRAGYRVDCVEHVLKPAFDVTELPVHLGRADFSESLIAEVESDPDAQIAQFVVRCRPLSEHVKELTIVQELHRANDDLFVTRAALARYQAEREVARATADESARRMEELERRVAALVANVTPHEGQTPHEAALDDARNRIAELEREANESQTASREVWRRNESLQWTLQEAERSIAGLTAQIAETTERIAHHEARLEELRSQAAAAEEARAAALGRIDELSAELAASRQQLEAERAGYDRAAETQSAVITELQGRIEALDAQVAELTETRNAALAEIESLRADAGERIAELGRLSAEVARSQQQFDAQSARVAEVEATLAAAQAGAREMQNGLLVELQSESQRADREAAVAAELEAEVCLMRAAMRAGAAARKRLEHRTAALTSQVAALQQNLLTTKADLAQHQAVLEERDANASEANAQLNNVRARCAELEAILTEQRSTFVRLETLARAALDESESNTAALEEAWTSLYRELESSRAEVRRLENEVLDGFAAIEEREARVQSLQGRLARAERESDDVVENARRSIAATRRELDEARREVERLSAASAVASTALAEARERAESLAAEVSIHKVRAVQAEMRTTELERQVAQFEEDIARGTHYVAHLETELANAKQWAHGERSRAVQAETRAAQAETRVVEVETRAEELAERVERAEVRLRDEAAELANAQQWAHGERTRALQAEARAVEAEARAVQAEARAGEAEARSVAAEQRVVEAEMRIDEFAERAERAETRLRDDAAATEPLQRELEAIRTAALAEKLVLAEYIEDGRRRIDDAEKRLGEAARYARHLESEVATAQRWARERDAHVVEVQSRHDAELQTERSHADALRAQIGALHQQIADLTQQIASLNQQIVASDRQLAERQTMHRIEVDRLTSEAAGLRERLASERDAGRAQRAEEAQARVAAEQRATTLVREIASLTVREEALRESLATAEHRLVAQAEEMVASVQSESRQVATLIDTIQSSHFWKLKRWLQRLRFRSFGR